MKTNMDVRSLGERESNYTNSSVRNIKESSLGKSVNSDNGKIAVGLLAGAGVGVLAGMLFAPRTGKDLRKQVTDSASKLSAQASSLYNTSREKVDSWTGKARKEISSNINTSPGADSTPNTNITPGRDVANDPATSITM